MGFFSIRGLLLPMYVVTQEQGLPAACCSPTAGAAPHTKPELGRPTLVENGEALAPGRRPLAGIRTSARAREGLSRAVFPRVPVGVDRGERTAINKLECLP